MKTKFEDYIKGNTPVIVDFFADTCETSSVTNPILKGVKEIVGSAATILKMNISKNEFYVDKYNIQSSPTVLIFRNGKELWRKAGVPSKYEIILFIARNMN